MQGRSDRGLRRFELRENGTEKTLTLITVDPFTGIGSLVLQRSDAGVDGASGAAPGAPGTTKTTRHSVQNDCLTSGLHAPMTATDCRSHDERKARCDLDWRRKSTVCLFSAVIGPSREIPGQDRQGLLDRFNFLRCSSPVAVVP